MDLSIGSVLVMVSADPVCRNGESRRIAYR